MRHVVSTATRQFGVTAATAVVALELAYAVALVLGLAALPTPDTPIGDPWFTALEVLILALAPALVGLFSALYAAAPPAERARSVAALVFAGLCAGVTMSLHAAILVVRRMPELAADPGLAALLGFRWPSLAYALDILAWDLCFPLAVLAAAPGVEGSPVARWVRRLLVASGVLALAGLSGVITGDMQWRNVGIVGYLPVFTAAAVLLVVHFRRLAP